MHALIRTIGAIANAALYHTSQLYATLHILALYELKDDIALRRFRVESLVGLLIPLLHRDDGVLSHSHIQIVLGTVHTECVGFKSSGYLACWQGIGMHRDEEIGIGTIGYVSTLMQWDEDIRLTGIHYPHIGHILLHILTKSQGYSQIDVLLFGNGTKRTRIMTAMTRIYY